MLSDRKKCIAAETSNERSVRLSVVRLQHRTLSTLYRGAFLYNCSCDYVNNHGLLIGDMLSVSILAEMSGNVLQQW